MGLYQPSPMSWVEDVFADAVFPWNIVILALDSVTAVAHTVAHGMTELSCIKCPHLEQIMQET